ncbi:MAG: hypothetical protein JNL94_09475 [Planctomycetes bacterium]|nr:hypothetical protein [Planctomycetota bacterium]
MLTYERARSWTVRDLLECMVATLDRERPEWRDVRGPESPAPGDEREVLRRIAVGVMRLRFDGDEPLHLHPELFASATDAELETLANAVIAPGGRNGSLRALRKLRRVSRVLSASVHASRVPFALRLRDALEHGEGRECAATLCESDALREHARLLAALAAPVERSTAGERFLARLDVDPDGERAEDIRRATQTLEAFATGSDAICGLRPACSHCDLAQAGYCHAASRSRC